MANSISLLPAVRRKPEAAAEAQDVVQVARAAQAVPALAHLRLLEHGQPPHGRRVWLRMCLTER